ncbi:MAG: AMP-binding protein [Polyangiales bacterium]
MSEKLLLDYVYDREASAKNELWLTQPIGAGELKKYSWGDAMNEARRMASYLKSLGYPQGSRIAIVSKNCAEMILSDLAIWMAGYVSVALYPTLSAETLSYCLEHSESKLLFVGKLDGWDSMRAGVPESMPKIAYSLAPQTTFKTWRSIVDESEPLDGRPTRDGNDLAIIIYTSGSTGKPKGVEHGLGPMTRAAESVVKAISNDIRRSRDFVFAIGACI